MYGRKFTAAYYGSKFSGKHQSSTQTTKAKQRKKCSSLMIISAGPVYLNRMESSWKPRGREVCVGQKMYKFVETIGGQLWALRQGKEPEAV